MATSGRELHASGRDPYSGNHKGGHRALLWLLISPLILLLVVASVVAVLHAHSPAASSDASTVQLDFGAGPPQPADLFIKSVVTENGELGWHQLCPDIQSHLPLAALVQQANAMRAQAAQAGVHVSVQSLGTRSQEGGWQLHLYRMTAHWASGATRQWIFNVLTQPSGCVEDIQS
jgi:hypothetical protein